MAIASGRLRHRVQIQEQVNARDSDGVLRPTWEPVATVWAAVEPLSAREFVAASQVQSEVSARITIRYRPGIRASMRILHRDRVYNIKGVLADQVSGVEYLTLPVSEGTNDGQ